MLPQACWSQLQRVKEIMQLDDGPNERTAQKSAAQYPRKATSRATPVVWQHSPRRGATLALLWGVLGAAFLGSLLLGHYPLAPDTVVAILASQVLDIPRAWPERAETVVLAVRVPRAAAAVLVGAALSVAGATYQSLFRNPLVSPAVLGVSAGAGFGAALAMTMHLSALAVQVAAFSGGLLAVGLSVWIAQRLGKGSPLVLILAGMAISAVFQALIAVFKYIADPIDVLPVITFWLMGGLGRVTGVDVLCATGPVFAALALVWALRWQVNVLALGDDEARALGVRVAHIRALLIVAATLMTAAVVSISGIVAWVGLLVPHMARLLVGPSFPTLLPVTLVLGGGYLLLVDDVCRSVARTDVPLGILTALLGAPVFILLLTRGRHGWF
jgi:iron complex transport system permease protein